MARSIICLGRGGLGKAFEERGVKCYDRKEADVNDIWSLNEVFQEDEPKYVINCTGMVGTGKCEHEPEHAYMVNVGGTSNIAYLCRKYNANLIHFSTFYVGNYNVYTRSKMLAENVVKDSKLNVWVVRLPWLFGRHTDNFILSAIKGKDVHIYEDELGYLAYDYDVVEYVINNIGSNGVSLVANDGQVDRKEIIEEIGCKYTLIKRQVNMPSIVPYPTVNLRGWKESLKEFKDGFRTMQPTV